MVGDKPWCSCARPAGFLAAAGRAQVLIHCGHPTAGNAVALVHLLQDFGVAARIVDGPCAWDPAQFEARKFGRRRPPPAEAIAA